MGSRGLGAFVSFPWSGDGTAPAAYGGGPAGLLAEGAAPARRHGNFHRRRRALRTRSGARGPGPSAHVSTPRPVRGDGRWGRRSAPGFLPAPPQPSLV